MWDRELLDNVIKDQVVSTSDSGLRKLMSQNCETMCPLKGHSEGTVPKFGRRVRVGTILREALMAESKE